MSVVCCVSDMSVVCSVDVTICASFDDIVAVQSDAIFCVEDAIISWLEEYKTVSCIESVTTVGCVYSDDSHWLDPILSDTISEKLSDGADGDEYPRLAGSVKYNNHVEFLIIISIL